VAEEAQDIEAKKSEMGRMTERFDLKVREEVENKALLRE
jgi:hypothetical protein